eukprot:bmy_07122T0
MRKYITPPPPLPGIYSYEIGIFHFHFSSWVRPALNNV